MILDIIRFVLPVLEKIIPDVNKRAEAQEAITRALIENQGALFQASKEVMVADAQSDSRYTASARPTIVYWSLGLVTLIVVASPFGGAEPIIAALRNVPDKLWDLMTYGIGAYVLGRSGEKMIGNLKGGK